MNNNWEQQIHAAAKSFNYPPTPDVTTAVTLHKQQTRTVLSSDTGHVRPLKPIGSLRLAWVVVLVVIGLLLTGLAVPQVRAAVLRIFRIGAITILETADRPTNIAPKATLTQDLLFNLAGETTLTEAQAQANFPLLVPEGWPLPDYVYYQENDWPVLVIFVWLKPDSHDEVQLSLYQLDMENFVYKGAERVEETEIKGQRAFWIEGEHWLQLQDGTVQPWHFVEGSVLIWWSDVGTTIRLESGLSLADAKALAESLVLLPEEE
jgi:hypothetical protein